MPDFIFKLIYGTGLLNLKIGNMSSRTAWNRIEIDIEYVQDLISIISPLDCHLSNLKLIVTVTHLFVS